MDSKQWMIIVIIAIIVIVIGVYASGILTGGEPTGNITVLAGAGTVKAMNDLITNFEKQNPKTIINVKYGGSGEIFANLATQNTGDVFVPGDEKFMKDAQNKGYIINNTVKPVVYHIPVIAVVKGNPKNITSVKDLANPGVRVALGSKNSTAIGMLSMKILNKTGVMMGITKNVVVYTPTVNQLLTYLTTGQVDAVIMTQDIATTGEGHAKIKVITIPKDQNVIATIPVGITTFTKNKNLATKFENYILSPDGLAIWKKWGFKPVNQ
jgi:molybdate transport system substrate-binding protein